MLVKRLSPETLYKSPVFSQVAVVPPEATLVYVGGQNGVGTDGQVVGKDIGSQTRQAMHNVVAALEAAGASLSDVFKFTIYLVQGQPLQAAFEAAQPFFPRDTPPATVSMLQVAGLANPDFLIEIEAVAAIKPGGQA
jgi:enamine deaminase RidA (YjgF/YER057c/UK114 family)